MKYTVKFKETVYYEFEVVADNEMEAEDEASDLYASDEADDFITDSDYKVVSIEPTET